MIGSEDTADPIGFYDRGAATFARLYDSITFAKVHPCLSSHLPKLPAAVLDIGAGSGRDARALAELGYHVTAVEPAAAFRAVGKAAGAAIEWVDDRLPHLPVVRGNARRFEFILCSAVLMSVPKTALKMSFVSMAEILAIGGRLAITVRDVSDDETLLHSHSDAAILDAASRARLGHLEDATLPDALGRPLQWKSFIFAKPPV